MIESYQSHACQYEMIVGTTVACEDNFRTAGTQLNMESLYVERIFWYHYRIAEKALLLQEPTLWARIANLQYFFDGKRDVAPNSNQFLLFYLSNTADMCIQFLSINILFLMVSIYIITQKQWGDFHLSDVDGAFDYYSPAIVDIVIWIIMSAMCLAFFLVYKYNRELISSMFASERTVWYEIGAAIICARLMMLIQQIQIAQRYKPTCFDCVSLGTSAQDTSFGFMFIKMTIDGFQAYAFVLLPFPQPWGVAFTLIELITQEARLLSCTQRIISSPTDQWIVSLAAAVLVLLYLSVLLVPSIYLEGSLRNQFKGGKLRNQADELKQEMVVFLSKDVRVPLQYMLHAITSAQFADMSGSSLQPLLKDIELHTRTVNDVADDLLLLVRIQEKRYTSKLSRVQNLRVLCDGLVQTVLQRRLTMPSERLTPAQDGAAQESNASTRASTASQPRAGGSNRNEQARSLRPCFVYADIPPVDLLVDENCLLAALRNLLIFVTQERAELANAMDPAPVEPLELELSVEVIEVPHSENGSSEKRLLQVVLTGDAATTRDWSEQRKVHEATTAYICSSIATVCGGTFTSKEFTYHLTIPCTVLRVSSPPSNLPPPPAERVPETQDCTMVFNSPEASGGFSDPCLSESAESAHIASQAEHNPDRIALDEKIKGSLATQARFKRKQMCVIVDDHVLESVIVGVIHKLCLGDGLSVLHELQKGDLIPVAKLTFVTSYQQCVELRRRRYRGLIVLFSGSTNYLDDAQVVNLDYCLPLPASDQQLSDFLDFLIRVHEKEVLRENARLQQQNVSQRKTSSVSAERVSGRNPFREPRTTSSKFTSALSFATDVSVESKTSAFRDGGLHEVIPVVTFLHKSLCDLQQACGSIYSILSDKRTSLLVTRLPEGSTETYTKWHWINPSNSWRHQATAQYFTSLPRMVLAFAVHIFLIHLPMDQILGAVSLAMFCLLLQPVYLYVIEPCGWRLEYFWLASVYVIDGVHVYAFVRSLFMTTHYDETNLSLNAFLSTEFDYQTFGGAYIYSQLTLLTFGRLYCMYQSHPYSIIGLIIVFARQTQCLWMVFRTILSLQMCEYLQWMLISMTVLNVIYLTYIEETSRQEFKMAQGHILARAFLDQCLDICQHDIRKPLEFLLLRQRDLMQVAVHAGYVRAIKLSPNFLSKLEPLHVSGALLAEMAQELSFIRDNILAVSTATEDNPRLHNLKTHYNLNFMQLHRAVAALISGLSSATGSGANVKIYAEIDNKLAVVRVDWKNLSMILTNLISAALRNIREFCLESPRHKDIVNYVKIKMVAIESDVKVPFVHPRLMLVNVCDSSNAAVKSAALARARGSGGSTIGRITQNASSGSTRSGREHDSELSEQRTSQYGRSVCEQLVRTVTPDAVFQTIAVESSLQTVQRFTFQYHLTPQTRRAQDYIQAETDASFVTVTSNVDHYLANYKRIIYPSVPKRNFDGTISGNGSARSKRLIFFTSVRAVQRNEIHKLTQQFDKMGWHCTVKYIVALPSMHSVASADCVLLDHQLEAQESVNVCDTVLKLRVCGFNGVIAVSLQDGLRHCDFIRDELAKSAAEADVIITTPLRDQHIQSLTVAMEKKVIRQLLFMNGN